jgi:hypothetical protein
MLSSVLGYLGSYAVAWGMWQLALGRRPTPLEVIAAPWREAGWSMPMAFLLSLLVVAGFLLAYLPAILVEIFLMVAAPVAAIEHTSGSGTLIRAWKLGDGHRLRAAGIFGLVAMGLIAAGLPAALLQNGEVLPVVLLLTAVLQGIASLVGETGAFLLYADLRVRKESFDVTAVRRQEIAEVG